MLSKLSIKLCHEIISGPSFKLDEFIEKHQYNHYIDFIHYDFYYSYPEFGKKWTNGELCCFHKVETCCYECNAKPDRNYAGIGTLYLVGFAPYLNGRLTLYCRNCVPGIPFNSDKRIFKTNNQQSNQLTLF